MYLFNVYVKFLDYFNNLQKNTTDDRNDKSLYTEETTAIKISFNLCLQIIKYILYYHELEEDNLLKGLFIKV